MFAISRHLEASVVVSTYCRQPSLPKKRKDSDKSFIKDTAFLSRWDDNEDEVYKQEFEDNTEELKDDFVVEDDAEKEEDKVSMPSCLKKENLVDLDEYNDSNKSKGRKH